MNHLILCLLSLVAMSSAAAQNREVSFKILETTDVHGNYFPYDFISREPGRGSLARVASYVGSLRDSIGEGRVLLFDNGDILQGQPTAYYYNFIDTVSPHLAASVMNFMGYDAASIGNHDVETGHAVYDRWRSQLSMPLLGANVISKSTGEPYLRPYQVFERDGVKIAVLGLLTPAIPAWLPENLWEGLEFEDMVDAARKWVPVIRERENPDVIIGLFHSGRDAAQLTGDFRENASLLVAQQVPGFDAVLFGHDHSRYSAMVDGPDGGKVAVVNPANNAMSVGVIDLNVTFDPSGKVISKLVRPSVVDVSALEPDSAFMAEFAPQREAVDSFVSRQVGVATGDFSTRDAYFGPSAFMQLLHDLQLEISGADISFAAPLSFDACIKAGPVTVSDMFKLYKYENMLYTMELTGREIKDYLEMSYSLWTNQMRSPSDPLLLFAENGNSAKGDYALLRNPSYNFDSAAGIDYTVDVTKPRGSKITITGFTDGRPFDMNARYKVAVNSYRGNGGGDLLTKGAGIPASELKSRIISSTDKDLRYYLMKAIERRHTITPDVTPNWRFIPASLTTPAIPISRTRLFKGTRDVERGTR